MRQKRCPCLNYQIENYARYFAISADDGAGVQPFRGVANRAKEVTAMPTDPIQSDEGTDGSEDRLERDRRRWGTVTNQRGVNLLKKRLEETPFRALKPA